MTSRKKDTLVMGVTFVAFLLLDLFITSRLDDLVFQDALNRYGSLWGWATWFSANWGGRTLPQGVLVVVLQMPNIVFHILDALAWVVLLRYAQLDLDPERRLGNAAVFLGLPVALFTLVPVTVLSGTVFWKCANVLYLWGTASALVALKPVLDVWRGAEPSHADVTVAFLCALYAAGFEQTGALMAGIMVVLVAYELLSQHRLRASVIVLTAFAVAATAFFVSLPGNATRSYAETLGRMQNFGMYSLVDKAILGLWYVIEGIETDVPALPLLLSLLVLVVEMRHRPHRSWPVVLTAFICAYFVLVLIAREGQAATGNQTLLTKALTFITPDTTTFLPSWPRLAASALHFMAYVALGTSILVAFPEHLEVPGFLLYFGGLATMWVMGFSPTVYASGARPRMICYLTLLLVALRLVTIALERDETSLPQLLDVRRESKQ